MDNSTIKSLLIALQTSPDNQALQKLIIQTYVDKQQTRQALDLINQYHIEGKSWDGDGQYLLATVYWQNQQYQQALHYLNTQNSKSLLLKARVYKSLDKTDLAVKAYNEAIAMNPALENPALKAELSNQVIQLNPKQHGRDDEQKKVKSIANDDTDAADVIRILQTEVEQVMFKDVGGLEHVKTQIRRKIIVPFQKPSLFQRFKKKSGGGILMYGPPGCGKTLLARATAGECGARFYNVAISDILDMYIGESERKLHEIFEQARRTSPSVLFFDEVEAIGGKRQYSRESTSSKLVSQFLSELDGFAQNNQGVLILAATNVPWAVDSAFRRPGRFDRILFIPPPDQPAREAILQQLMEDRPSTGKINYGLFAKQTSTFSGADLRAMIETAVDEAIEESIDAGQEIPLTQAHLQAAFKQHKSTTLEWLTTARNYARYSNEAGQYDDVLDFLKKHGKS